MALMTRIQSWRKAPRPIERPAPTTGDRADAIRQLGKIDSQRDEVAQLQQAADAARVERDKARAAFNTAQANYGRAQQRASCLGASLDSQARRQRDILRKTCSPSITEFLATIIELQSGLRIEGVLTSAPPSGKFTQDGHKHKQGWSTFSSAGERAKALVHARQTAEDMRFLPMTEAEVEAKLQELFDALPVVDYQHC